jgi:rhamnopyranosyl-N-acetylglucosaminyl-diphospho-decaprenol beta-1,3/1,4-galactofuranosyltransferase
MTGSVRTRSVHVVVVAYQRRDLLRESLAAITAQTHAPDVIHVVDNASDDGSAQMVATEFPTVRLHALSTNTGGAGGFAAGLAFALQDQATVVWLMDDDTVPHADALAALLRAYDAYPGRRPALVASRVVWEDGRDHPMNTPREKPRVGAAERADAAAAVPGGLAIRSASFVSLLVDADAVRAVGLPQADFFLWNDDFEFTTRLLRGRRGLWCPDSVVEHRTKTFGSTDADPGDRFYFEVRNKLWTFTRSDGLSGSEKAIYAASTLRRWTRTVAHSQRRGPLWHGLRRGLVDGVRRGPRTTADVLHRAGVDLPEGTDPGRGPVRP